MTFADTNGFTSALPWMPPSTQRIAVIRALHLGDLLLAVPALRTLRFGFPDAEITFVGLPWAASFVERFTRYLDRFVEFPGFPGIDEAKCDAERTSEFIAQQRDYHYDLVVQMHGSGRASNPLALAFGGRVTAGYFEEQRGHNDGLTVGAPYPHDRPEIFRNLGLMGLIGLRQHGTSLEFPLTDTDRLEAHSLLPYSCKPVPARIGIHPGASAPARRWPPERFAAVADHVAARYGAQIILTGGPNERTTADKVAASTRASVINVAGKTSLGGVAALIETMDLFISNDTGPAHIADAIGVSSVTIFGPADPRRWAALNTTLHPIVRRPVACSPCSFRECPIDHRCLQNIETAHVIEAAERLIHAKAMRCGA